MNLNKALHVMKMTSVPDKKSLKSSYRRLAKQAHPDLNGSHHEFNNLRDAYEFLSSYIDKPTKKRNIFPNTLSVDALSHNLTISIAFEESCLGVLKKVSFNRMAMSTRSGKCELCWGRGYVSGMYDKLKKCNLCNSEPTQTQVTKMIRIPAGIQDNQNLFFKSEGHSLDNMAGNLAVNIRVAKDKTRTRDGWNVIEKMPVTYSDLLLGKKIIAKTVHGDQRVAIPFGSFDGDVLRLKGKGICSKKKSGDHLVNLCLIAPGKLSDEQKEALENLRKVGL